MLRFGEYQLNEDQIGMILYGMRNSWNSWSDADTYYDPNTGAPKIGEKDMNLCKKLCKAGPSHRKFMRMITVVVDISAPLHWWKQMDTYVAGKVQNSTSTMHTITKYHLHITDFGIDINNHDEISIALLRSVIDGINTLIDAYNMEDTPAAEKAAIWRKIIDILPSSYMQRRTVSFSYETLANIYNQRKGHKLAEWKEFLEWIEKLPYSELITGKFKEDEKEDLPFAASIKIEKKKTASSDKESYDEHMKPAKDILKKRRDENKETIYTSAPRGSSKSLSENEAISLLALLAAFTSIDIEKMLDECCEDDDDE